MMFSEEVSEFISHESKGQKMAKQEIENVLLAVMKPGHRYDFEFLHGAVNGHSLQNVSKKQLKKVLKRMGAKREFDLSRELWSIR